MVRVEGERKGGVCGRLEEGKMNSKESGTLRFWLESCPE
jgi:hypothetical protein